MSHNRMRLFTAGLLGVLFPSMLLSADLNVIYTGRYATEDGHGLGAYGVVVSGNLAYVAAGHRGLQVIDLSKQSNWKLSECDTDGFAIRVAVAGHYAYVADGNGGLVVVDISNPAAPQRVGRETNTVRGVSVSGNFACAESVTNGFHVIDISDPANPQRVGSYATAPYARVAMLGNFVYVADRELGLQVINVSNPSAPQRVGGYSMSGDAVDVVVRGNYAYVAEARRLVDGKFIGQGGLQVIEISDPANPRRVGGYTYEDPRYVVAVSVAGNLACLMADGLRIIDISNPVRPELVGGTFGGLPNDDLDTLAFSGGFVCVPDYAAGLHVYEMRAEAKLSVRAVGTNEIVISFERLAVLGDVFFAWYESADLIRWQRVSPARVTSTLSADPTRERVSAAFSINASTKFYRLAW